MKANQAISFLEKKIEEYDDIITCIKTMEEEHDKIVDAMKAEYQNQTDEISALKNQIEELEQAPTTDTIECGIGHINWFATNMDCERLMELLGEKIKQHGVKATIEHLYQ